MTSPARMRTRETCGCAVLYHEGTVPTADVEGELPWYQIERCARHEGMVEDRQTLDDPRDPHTPVFDCLTSGPGRDYYLGLSRLPIGQDAPAIVVNWYKCLCDFVAAHEMRGHDGVETLRALLIEEQKRRTVEVKERVREMNRTIVPQIICDPHLGEGA